MEDIEQKIEQLNQLFQKLEIPSEVDNLYDVCEIEEEKENIVYDYSSEEEDGNPFEESNYVKTEEPESSRKRSMKDQLEEETNQYLYGQGMIRSQNKWQKIPSIYEIGFRPIESDIESDQEIFEYIPETSSESDSKYE